MSFILLLLCIVVVPVVVVLVRKTVKYYAYKRYLMSFWRDMKSNVATINDAECVAIASRRKALLERKLMHMSWPHVGMGW